MNAFPRNGFLVRVILLKSLRIHYLNINDRFLDESGRLPEEIMPDFLHPRADGYKIWAEAIEEKLVELGL